MQKITTKLFLSLLLICSSAAFAADSKSTSQAPWNRKAIVETLQNGGNILVIRHERTEFPSRSDDYSKAPDDCRAQRNLSVAGVAGALETGVLLQALNIKVDRVVSSPMCRCTETARYMFGANYEADNRLLHPNVKGKRNREVANEEFKQVLQQIAPGLPNTNIALIGHGGIIRNGTGLALSEGEVGVIKLDKDGNVTIIGQFVGSDLAPTARKALSKVKN